MTKVKKMAFGGMGSKVAAAAQKAAAQKAAAQKTGMRSMGAAFEAQSRRAPGNMPSQLTAAHKAFMARKAQADMLAKQKLDQAAALKRGQRFADDPPYIKQLKSMAPAARDAEMLRRQAANAAETRRVEAMQKQAPRAGGAGMQGRVVDTGVKPVTGGMTQAPRAGGAGFGNPQAQAKFAQVNKLLSGTPSKLAKGGAVGRASARADGIASKGKTRGRMV